MTRGRGNVNGLYFSHFSSNDMLGNEKSSARDGISDVSCHDDDGRRRSSTGNLAVPFVVGCVTKHEQLTLPASDTLRSYLLDQQH